MAELISLVSGRATLHFGDRHEWAVTADWAADRPFFCTAVPVACEQRLATLGGRRVGQRLYSSLNALLSLCRNSLPRDGWVWIHDHDRGHCLRLTRGAIDYCRTTVHGEVLEPDQCLEAAESELRTAAALAGPGPADDRLIVVPGLVHGEARLGSTRTLGFGMGQSADTSAAWALAIARALCEPRGAAA